MVDVALGERGCEVGAGATMSRAALAPAAAVELTEDDLFESLRGELQRLQVRKCRLQNKRRVGLASCHSAASSMPAPCGLERRFCIGTSAIGLPESSVHNR